MFFAEAKMIEEELREEFRKSKDGLFKYEKSFRFADKEYLRVAITGIKIGNRMQYTVVIDYADGTVTGEVKGSQILITSNVDPTPKNIISEVNRVLTVLEVIRGCTVIPSDVGDISTLEILFENLNGLYSERVIKIPLRPYRIASL